MQEYRVPDLIAAKRDGKSLTEAQFSWLVRGYLSALGQHTTDHRVSEGQMAAFLMAGVLQGFNEDEALALTRVMTSSGELLDLSGLDGPTIDKHSTGGVGDGTTLLVAPLLAAAGAQLMKLSGRGLGHTGGTLDKLESIPGLRVDLEPEELRRIVAEVGCVVAAQTDRLVPADRALYALRDVTATVDSPALIASSVMSKKLAAGAETIVLDVKAGNGAFMQTLEDAEMLASLCVRIGVGAGRRCAAVVTAMDQPLGRGVGNALEVAECVELLHQDPTGRLAEVAIELAATALSLARHGTTAKRAACREEIVGHWRSGAALERLARMIAAQGGDPAVCERPRDVLPAAPVVRPVPAGRSGFLAALPARRIGELAAALGAGRAQSGDRVDPAVGIEVAAEIGDELRPEAVLATVHARDEDDADAVSEELSELLTVADEPVERPATIMRVVD